MAKAPAVIAAAKKAQQEAIEKQKKANEASIQAIKDKDAAIEKVRSAKEAVERAAKEKDVAAKRALAQDEAAKKAAKEAEKKQKSILSTKEKAYFFSMRKNWHNNLIQLTSPNKFHQREQFAVIVMQE